MKNSHHPPARPAGRHRRVPLLVVVALLLALAPWSPGPASAAPMLILEPASGPCGSRTVARGVGFPPGTPMRFTRDVENAVIRGRGVVGTDGTFAVLLEVLCYTHAPLPVGSRVVVTAESEYFRGIPYVPMSVSTLFTVTAGQPLEPTLTLHPDRGPCATRPLARGAGFPAGSTIDLSALDAPPDLGAGPIAHAVVDAAGDFAVALPSLGCRPEDPDGARVTIAARIAAADGPSDRAAFTIDRTANERCFAESGHCVRNRFLAHWRTHGLDLGDPALSERESLALFGYPLSDEFVEVLEDGKPYTVQYFERARFEHHPENLAPYDVLLGQFGRRIVAGVPGAPVAPTPPSSQPGALYFPESEHSVTPSFAAFWLRNGGLAVFGYPLSEPFTQVLEDGQPHIVQYFERARLEQHPAQEGMPDTIQLGQFGRRILAETVASR